MPLGQVAGKLRTMVNISDIFDRNSLKECLTDRPREDAVMIAHRVAMRVAPVYWEFGGISSAESDLTEMPILRSCLISGVGVWATPEIRAVARAATAPAAPAKKARAKKEFIRPKLKSMSLKGRI